MLKRDDPCPSRDLNNNGVKSKENNIYMHRRVRTYLFKVWLGAQDNFYRPWHRSDGKQRKDAYTVLNDVSTKKRTPG